MVPAVYAQAGLIDEASAFLDDNGGLFAGQDGTGLKARVAQWKAAFDALPAAPAAGPAGGGSPTRTLPDPASPDSPGPLAYAWSDCVQEVNSRKDRTEQPATVREGDETAPMMNLPSPCRGRPMPRMAIADVTLLRTNDTRTSSHGINLLENLAVTIQQSANRTVSRTTGAEPVTTSTLNQTIGLGTSAGGAIAYSLNIANVTGQTTEVIARPSLLMLDRQPSQFFSGSNVSIGLPAGVGGTSTIEQINVGVSLSVTPTFVDDRQLLLNVKAARTFFEPVTGSSTFAQSLQTSRNMVSAATRVRVNETLVLSGLTEHEEITGTSGVPLLKDLPVMESVFSRNTQQSFNKTVLILITPRSASAQGDSLDRLGEPQGPADPEPRLLQEARAQALRDLNGRWPGLQRAVRPMDRATRAFGVRGSDIKVKEWKQPDRVRRLLQDAADSVSF